MARQPVTCQPARQLRVSYALLAYDMPVTWTWARQAAHMLIWRACLTFLQLRLLLQVADSDARG